MVIKTGFKSVFHLRFGVNNVHVMLAFLLSTGFMVIKSLVHSPIDPTQEN